MNVKSLTGVYNLHTIKYMYVNIEIRESKM